MVHVFVYCDCGSCNVPPGPSAYHYNLWSHCPNSGYTPPGYNEVYTVVQRLREQDRPITLTALDAEGVDRKLLSRVLLIEAEDGVPLFNFLSVTGSSARATQGLVTPLPMLPAKPWWAFWRKR